MMTENMGKGALRILCSGIDICAKSKVSIRVHYPALK
jgi:hypothetical protein